MTAAASDPAAVAMITKTAIARAARMHLTATSLTMSLTRTPKIHPVRETQSGANLSLATVIVKSIVLPGLNANVPRLTLAAGLERDLEYERTRKFFLH